MKGKALLLFFVMVCNIYQVQAQDSLFHKNMRMIVNLLDYVSKDYPNAVKDGEIISASEYQEMEEFCQQIKQLHQKLSIRVNKPKFKALDAPINRLSEAITQKASEDTVAVLASHIQQQILAGKLIKVTPSFWPNLEHGQQIFVSACKSCHGKAGFGDGPLAKGLDPQPTNFHDSSLAAKLSPLQAYNTIRLGIDGTAMRPFNELSDKEAWDVAFYINHLNYQTTIGAKQKKQIKKTLKDSLSLKKLTTWKNEQWMTFFKKHHIDQQSGLAVVRSMDQAEHGANNKDYLAEAINMLNKASNAYETDRQDRALSLALNAYVHGVEPVESQIKASNLSLVTELENKLMDIRSAIKQGKSSEVVQQKIQSAILSIKNAQNLVTNQNYTFWVTFMMAASILLREGLEAVLIIMVIISVLKSMGAERSLTFVHAGWLLALGLGIASWFFTETLLQMSSFQREVMEGTGSLIAVGMMLYIGFWLHNKTHASQWTTFVKEKITRLVDENNRWGLATLAFIVVFREAFESVIFLSSVTLKSSPSGDLGILWGVSSALLAVIVMAFVVIRFSARIPIRFLFKYSSFVMAVLAMVLVGKGVHEFQEAGYITIHSLPMLPRIPWLGLYPTLFTILAQLAIAACIWGLRQYSKHLAIAQK